MSHPKFPGQNSLLKSCSHGMQPLQEIISHNDTDHDIKDGDGAHGCKVSAWERVFVFLRMSAMVAELPFLVLAMPSENL